ncbi:UDP-N-acetylmuramate dehydrogenase [Kineosporia sp. NBRC 101731]|uniref:UDP-N-acetylmuramate dehydrogenase n=1 Tax=Kineosporia sp. NBRC 101731 TaxID=3032199 RepID=UPI00249FC2B5|nr:UDP-N-acetylmuramate dehydrogenase [Kineosporia sp. NBRC 101731]GLY27663.1 UDP-N-acetylenolpyruvoylglucosamine reductase [Kineosporia sp. NBRC 101731]
MTLLADLTTLRVGGPARRHVIAASADDILAAVREADDAGEPLLLIGGGSNLVIGDAGFEGTVIQVASRGITVHNVDYCGGAEITVEAGEPWDGVVARAVTEGWIGVEALSGIPGSTGATPVQNVGAYGQEVSGTVASVRTWDRAEQKIRTLAAADCRFGYRDSLFKRERFRGGPRYVVLQVSFQFVVADFSEPVKYAELARSLGVEIGDRVPLAQVRDNVLELRAAKGMVLDAPDHDTWSAGSFFTNPVLPADQAAALPADAPRYPTADGLVKTSAAWLIDHAGFSKGFGLPGPASLSTKHTLALTNRGPAVTADVLDVARQVRDGVEKTYGVRLVPEPELIGCEL